MATRRRDKRVWFLALGIFSAVFLFSFLTQKFKSLEESAEAASLANFDPGYIISDYQMGNYNSMSEAEIQKFLTSKNPCSNRDYGYYQRLSANNPNVKWHFSDGHFVCLSEELFGDGEVIGSGETAAHIIWQAAQDYRINPQVLIVLLQKESGLITDPIPNNVDYRTAAGYGCPDTASCSSEYFGLKNQIRKAAALFRTVLDGGWTNYPLGNNYIQYNPSASCGGSVVNIRSLATSALYRYTPYQPNAGAIAAGYGTAECGAYGNRNFYLYFEDWFGGVTDTKSQEEIENSLIKEKFDKYDYSGTYNILYSENNNKAISVNNNNIETVMYNNSKAQQWVVKKEEDYYIITNKSTGKALDLSGGVFSNKANIWQYNLNKTCAQRWNFIKNSDGTVTIHSVCYPKYVLDLADGNSNVQVYTKINNNNHQKWHLTKADEVDYSGTYNILYSENNNKAIDVVDNNIETAVYNNSKTQQWVIKKEEDYYTITNKSTGKALDLSGGVFSNKANIWQYNLNKTCAQRWNFIKNSDGTVTIHSVCYPKYVLDLADGNSNVQVYTKTDYENLHQKWVMQPN